MTRYCFNRIFVNDEFLDCDEFIAAVLNLTSTMKCKIGHGLGLLCAKGCKTVTLENAVYVSKM